MNNKVLIKAKKFVKNPDLIVNLYDFSIFYASKKIAKVLVCKEEDLIDKSILNLGVIPKEIVYNKVKNIVNHSPKGDLESISIKDFNGVEKILKIKGFYFEFEGVYYATGEILSVKKK
jgi:hypothetical protein